LFGVLSPSGQFDRHVDELAGQMLEALAIGDGGLQSRCVRGRDALTKILPMLPDLVLEVGTGGTAASGGTVFSFE
jgi:hypothetical protein